MANVCIHTLHPQKHRDGGPAYWGSLFPILWPPEPDIPSRHAPQREELLSLCLTASRWQSRVSKQHPVCQARGLSGHPGVLAGCLRSAHSCAPAGKGSPHPGLPVCQGTRGLCVRFHTCTCGDPRVVCMHKRGLSWTKHLQEWGFSWLLRPGAQTQSRRDTAEWSSLPMPQECLSGSGLVHLCVCLCVFCLWCLLFSGPRGDTLICLESGPGRE